MIVIYLNFFTLLLVI